ncbi:MAG TPA: hypothetical protein VFP71_09595, partial [Candidatus Angelobacter sp.]|nr:hypothetical protein [Candidatus Angelobacter sp.]
KDLISLATVFFTTEVTESTEVDLQPTFFLRSVFLCALSGEAMIYPVGSHGSHQANPQARRY